MLLTLSDCSQILSLVSVFVPTLANSSDKVSSKPSSTWLSNTRSHTVCTTLADLTRLETRLSNQYLRAKLAANLPQLGSQILSLVSHLCVPTLASSSDKVSSKPSSTWLSNTESCLTSVCLATLTRLAANLPQLGSQGRYTCLEIKTHLP